MPVNPSRKIDVSQKLKAIRPYVNFDYDLRKPLAPQSKAKINKYYRAFIEYSSDIGNGIHLYRARSKQHLRTAQEAAGMDNSLKDFKVAFIPKPQRGDIKVKFTKTGKLRIKSKNANTGFIPLNAKKLVGPDARNYINSRIADNPFPRYTVTYGEFTSPVMQAKFVAEHVEKLASKYDVAGNHNYKNWLKGVWGMKFINQEAAAAYNVAKNKASKKRVSDAARARRRERRRKTRK